MKSVVLLAVVLATCTLAIQVPRSFGYIRSGVPAAQRKYVPADRLMSFGDIPKILDWRTKGAVTPVQNSGMCASSVADAVAANIEGIAAVRYGKLNAVSGQELVDCVTGCSGATLTSPYEFLMNHTSGAIASNKTWPYGTRGSGVCNHYSNAAAVISEAYHISSKEKDMATVVASFGPIAVAINALPLQLYTNGVLSDCSADSINQAVAVVGYNLEASTPYWIIKNNWGTSWGMEGYAYLQYGNNTCGITTEPVTGDIAPKF